MFMDAAQRRFDVVLFWALDRLTREGALETLQYLNQLSRYGVGYRSFTEAYLDSCGMFREAVIAILGAIAKTGTGTDFRAGPRRDEPSKSARNPHGAGHIDPRSSRDSRFWGS